RCTHHLADRVGTGRDCRTPGKESIPRSPGRAGTRSFGGGTEQGCESSEAGVELGDLSLIRALLRTEDPGGPRVPEERIGDITENGGAAGRDRPKPGDIDRSDGAEPTSTRSDRSAVSIREHGTERAQCAHAAVG